jgi:hypothetical protein
MTESAIDFFTNPPSADLPNAPLPGLPKPPKQRVITEKHLKRIAKEMQMGMRLLDRMNRLPLMTEQERKERRRVQQIERRNAKALSADSRVTVDLDHGPAARLCNAA